MLVSEAVGDVVAAAVDVGDRICVLDGDAVTLEVLERVDVGVAVCVGVFVGVPVDVAVMTANGANCA